MRMGIAARWIPPLDTSIATVSRLLLAFVVIFGVGVPFLMTARDHHDKTRPKQTLAAFACGAAAAALVAWVLVWSGQYERWLIIGGAFAVGFTAMGVVLSLGAELE
jgi:hypothetical protein